MKKHILLIVIIINLLSCKNKSSTEITSVKTAKELLNARYKKLLEYPLDSLAFPRSVNLKTNTIKKVLPKDWCSGFFPGNLWQIYDLTGNEAYKNKAKEWTAYIENEKFNNRTHDMGFKIFCSFGNGLKHEENEEYKKVIVESAKTLSTRFNEHISSIRSWDFNKNVWQFPVIIDNMMNLELLFEAAKTSKDSSYYNLAVKHANTTLKNHFRPDNSCYHVVDYDTISFQPRMKVTHQGFNNESSWSRGQGWAIYGYTMAYRYTKDKRYLNQAEATANFFINHKNLPEDGIPYWDFNDPSIPNAPRDVSAGAIVSSALVELYGYTNNETYLNYSKKVVNSLKSKNYLLNEDIEAPFILDHSTGNWPKNDEVDEPIVYGDYYFLETLLRLKTLRKKID
ncbi:glycoside hydrolase family 88 protein [Algibacter sp. L4_22]|uniref:glycoside hydrolase family 88 protein n=1 Tax=Algibacter sp. L4_22 TaxID=2942477 RepID=UPI00201B6AFF|nr:glycoside hydrolase family 88 protein [Algibacter sp. L4_22]MCL5126868.1 glycoside hydrolase family 88 protein [Algibacter sp. L4_22]